MAGEWRVTNLADVCERVSVGYVGPTSEYFCEPSEGVRMLRSQNVRPGKMELNDVKYVRREFHHKNKKSQLKAGDILFVRVGQNRGDCCIVPEGAGELNCANIVFARPQRALGAFLGFYFRSFIGQQQLRSISTGSAQGVLNTGAIASLKVPVPTDDEAQRIASVLGALDDKIELNLRMNATLEAMARALFQSWFVDFDPVRAKLDGRKPAGLDHATAELFPAAFQESSLGPIPLGWEVCPLFDKIQLLSGGTPRTSEPTYWDGDIPWYSVRDAPSETDVWVIRTDKHVSKLGIANSAAQVFPEKTTIISARGTVGKLALTAVPMAMNQSCYGVRGIPGYGDYFTYYSLSEATAQLQQRTHGTVFDTITTETFKTLDCVFPTPNITAAFDKLVEPLLVQIRANLHQSRTLAALRDMLLPKLLSGELTAKPEK